MAGRVTAVLGPTNTGKTHYAIERMLGYRTGVIGLPLRLLAREVYDRIVAIRGPSVVALVTGEERIVPARTQWWVCTVEAMPEGLGTDFVAIDEIQLCADAERGHVFTDRLLRARGLQETLFLGSDTMRGAIAELVPEAGFQRRERFSTLSYAGSRKITRMRPRSAIVGFSAESVYAIAELIRRQKGGAAVVMGALSPRTRNAQVAMYQNGDVDYLVATDAIGMGLNLDIDHVAFASTVKFDGRRMRPLAANELGQIAGRAGRFMNDGTFGVTGEATTLDDETVAAVTRHSFGPVRRLSWRNAALDFRAVDALIASLEVPTDSPILGRAREADDLRALKALADMAEPRARATDPRSVRLLWDVCRIPDFRDISSVEHAEMLARIYEFLHERGEVPDHWLAVQVQRIDRTDGDIDTLSKRLAFIRTWTYVAQRTGWVSDESRWREETRAVEDRLSDALHGALTQRFVDRRTSVLMRRLKQKEAMLAEVNDKGEVNVEGHLVGRLDGFRFTQDTSASPDEARTLRQASLQALKPEMHLRADRLYNSPDTELDFTEQGGLMWGENAIGKLVAGAEPLRPSVHVFVDDEAGPEVLQKVQRRLQHFIDRRVSTLFEPLIALQKDDTLDGLARGFAFRLVENLGILPRDAVAREVKDLDQAARGALRKHGVRFGQFTVFMPVLLKPAPTRLRLVLWSLARGLDEFPESPPPGLVTVPVAGGVPAGYHAMAGYREAGVRAIRIDMLERLADLLRQHAGGAGFEATPDMLSITGMTLEQFADLMRGLGYSAEAGERPRAPRPTGQPAAESPSAENTPLDPAGGDLVPEGGAGSDDSAAGAPAETSDDPDPETGSAQDTPALDDGARQTDAVAPPETQEEAEEVPKDDDTGETEVYYTFAWVGRRAQGGKPRGDRKEGAKGKRAGPKRAPKPSRAPRTDPTRSFEAKPPRRTDRIDPDNPFAAALMGLKDKS